MVGDVDTHDGIASRLCAYSGANVVSVEYRTRAGITRTPYSWKRACS
jgi:hypothetical protein